MMKQNSTLLLIIFSILLLTSCDCWQDATGTIFDQDTQAPLEGVIVTSFTKGELTRTVVTDSTGTYDIGTSNTGNCNGYLSFTVSKDGYKSQEHEDPPFVLDVFLEKE